MCKYTIRNESKTILQICIEGICSPFYPDGREPLPDVDDNDIDKSVKRKEDEDVPDEPLDIVDGRPAWYDPIFTEVFIELQKRFVS